MKTLNRALITLSVIILLTGCASVFNTVVTVTSVARTAMKAWADLSVAGKTTPAIDSKVAQAYAQYQKSCAIAEDALKAYKANGDKATYEQAFAIVKATAAELIALIAPIIAPDKAAKMTADLAKATKI